MVDQNIIDYLSEGLRLGHKIGPLRQKLLEAGYAAPQIDEAINNVDSVPDSRRESYQGSDMEKPKKSSKKIWLLLGIFGLVIILTAGYFIFQPFSSDSNLNSSSGGTQSQEVVDNSSLKNSPLAGGTQSQEVVDCGQTPLNFAEDTGDEYEGYFLNHPEVKESLECISEGFNSCSPSEITYLGSPSDTIFVVNRSEGNKCIVQLVYEDKAIECSYAFEQIALIRSITERQLESWWDAYGISLGLGFKIFQYSPGETTDAGIYNSETGETSPVPCVFYSPNNS